MKLQIEIDDTATNALQEMIETRIPVSRQDLVREATREVLHQTEVNHPVDTGRSQAAWNSARQQLDGPATGFSSGGASQQNEGTLTSTHDHTTSTISATNHVPYVVYLEYGTSKMAPVAMLRESLAGVLGRLSAWFRLTN